MVYTIASLARIEAIKSVEVSKIERCGIRGFNLDFSLVRNPGSVVSVGRMRRN
jgi:hypothetical protein